MGRSERKSLSDADLGGQEEGRAEGAKVLLHNDPIQGLSFQGHSVEERSGGQGVHWLPSYMLSACKAGDMSAVCSLSQGWQ